ncbi:MAG: class I SAM-dependent methyltransferase [Cyclobacteriaceae bacterium]
MNLKFEREKKYHLLLSFFYKLDKIIPLSNERKFKLYLDLEWIFERLAHEKSFKVFKNHPVRSKSFSFLKSKLHPDFCVLDLGCNTGDLSYLLSTQTKRVVGIDFNRELIVKARQSFAQNNLEFIHGEAMAYLYKNTQRFEVLVLSHILEHLDTPGSFLIDFKKYFTFIYIEVPDFERTPLNNYRQELNSTLIYSDSDHIWEFDRIGIIDIINEGGLEILDKEYRHGVQKYWCKVTN